jgi:hypothetical protein
MLKGYVTEKPYRLPPGQRLAVQSALVKPRSSGTSLVDAGNTLNGPMLALWCLGNNVGNHRGSAFLLAPGVAITARHVIEDYEANEGLFKGGAELIAFGQQGGVGLSWIVHSVMRPEAGDAAILLMDLHSPLPNDFTLMVYAPGARIPGIGELGTVLGIRTNLPDGVNAIGSASGALGKLEASTIASTGPVSDHYPERGPLVGAPCFAIEATAIGCMSGGPIFDERGMVVGMISNSIAFGQDYTTIGALLWDILSVDIEPSWPVDYWPSRTRLRDLMDPAETVFIGRVGTSC